jgi:hypothetical protein
MWWKHMSKDQAIGGAILVVCALVAILYTVTLFYPQWLVTIGLLGSTANVGFWVIAIPVFVAFVAIMLIGAWIGWTMATTPPPKPIEEITTEMEEKKEEATEEPSMSAPEESNASMPEKKKKN